MPTVFNPKAYRSSRIWQGLMHILRRPTPSFRELLGDRMHEPTVIAVGGNSFDGLEKATANNIARVMRDRSTLMITHGNGPQVGKKLEESEKGGLNKSLAQCTRETQIEMGEKLRRELSLRGVNRVEVIPTRVIVDEQDPAFKNPTKYIGRTFPLSDFLSQAEALENGLYRWNRNGSVWLMKEVPGRSGMFRRVVPSPKPIEIHPTDMKNITKAIFHLRTAIAVGGGGIPVLENGKEVDAVIDKDLATALLAREISSRELIISTGVTYVAHGFGTEAQQDISYIWAKPALKNLLKGQYPAGAMGEKIEAAINALRNGTNLVLISHPEADWLNHEGTVLTRGLDLTGRFYNLGAALGLTSPDLQRWLVT